MSHLLHSLALRSYKLCRCGPLSPSRLIQLRREIGELTIRSITDPRRVPWEDSPSVNVDRRVPVPLLRRMPGPREGRGICSPFQ